MSREIVEKTVPGGTAVVSRQSLGRGQDLNTAAGAFTPETLEAIRRQRADLHQGDGSAAGRGNPDIKAAAQKVVAEIG